MRSTSPGRDRLAWRTDMSTAVRFSLSVAVAAVAFAIGARAEAPHLYAIRGARVVTVVGTPLASGTIVIRGGVIEAIGADVQVPSDAVVIEGAGLTAYPG